MSLGFIMSGMCLTSTFFDWWNYLTIFSWRFRCLIPFEVTEAADWTSALLSLYIMVQDYASIIPISLARCFSDWISVSHLLLDNIYASQEINTVLFLLIYFHAIGPPERQMRKHERERNLNSSRGVPYSTALPNLPPQLVSQKAVSWWNYYRERSVAYVYAYLSWWCGKWLNAWILDEDCEWNKMPYSLVLVSYLIAWTAAL